MVRSVGAAFALAALTALLAKVAFRLPFTPVPVTLQVLGVVLSGLLLGSRFGAVAQIQYLAAGVFGAPVFAGWTAGPASFLGPSGGYLSGFVVGAFITGLVFERSSRPYMARALAAGAAGVAGIYLCGAAWLHIWLAQHGGAFPGLSAWLLGIAPFIGVDAVKVTAAAAIVTGLVSWKR
ncbi:MAG: biotin transporter BioY [Armatimonadetes bacterium]|nr:biotin transporter BioY [Armatimonadota bacterium]